MNSIPRDSAPDLTANPAAAESPKPQSTDKNGPPTTTELPNRLEESVAALKRQFAPLAQLTDLEARTASSREIYSAVRALLNSATAEGTRDMVGEATALAEFLKELSEKPTHLTDSSVRTISLALDVLGLLVRAPRAAHKQVAQGLAVVVDSQHVSRTVTCNALRNADLNPRDFVQAEEALSFLESHAADLVVLDAATVAEGDFALYNKVRELPLHHQTPLIFVSNPGEAKPSEGSASCGETQFLTKPYNLVHYLELALKARSRVLKHRLANPPKASGPTGAGGNHGVAVPGPEDALSQLEETHAALRNAHSQLQSQYEQTRSALKREAEQREQLEKALAELSAASSPSAKGPAEPGQPEPTKAIGPGTDHSPEPTHDAGNPAGGSNATEASLEAERHAARQLQKRIDELQQLLLESNKELACVKAGAPKPRGVWGIFRGQGKPQEPAPESAPKEKESRCSELERELAAVRQARDELQAKLTAQIQTAAEAKPASEPRPPADNTSGGVNELSGGQRQMRESVALRARATAELEQERGERRRVEQRVASLTKQLQDLHEQLKLHLESESGAQNRIAELENVLRERDEALSRTTAELQRESAERKITEEQLRTTHSFSAQLRNCLSSFDAAKQAFKRSQEQIESRLQASQKALSESEARLQKETSERQRIEQALTEGESRLQKEVSERQRLEEALAKAQRALNEQTQRSEMDISKLQSDLEVEQAERKRIEGDALQMRYASLDSARVGVSLANKLRNRMQSPVDTLVQTTRRLLEAQLEAESKKLVETSFEYALLLQTVLQESAGMNDVTPEAMAADQPGPNETSPPAVAA